MSFKLVSFFYI